jgi:hypothetical protein
MAGRAIASAYVNLIPSIDNKAISSELNKLGTNAGNVGAVAGRGFSTKFSSAIKIGLATAGVAALAGLTTFVKGSITAASDAEESINAINVSFGKAAGGILKLSEGTAKRLGVSGVDFRNAAVRFSSFAETIGGGDTQKVVGVIDKLTGRATDFASVFNLDVKEALGVFQSGLAGETEPLKRFGIDLSAAAVNSFAYANGIATTGKELTESEKVQARYGLLLERTSKTQGDFANTSDGLANQQRILDATFQEIQRTVGIALLPIMSDLAETILTDIVPAIEDFAERFSAGTTPVNDFIDALKITFDFIKNNWQWMSILAGTILGVVGAIKLVIGIYNLWKAATVAFTIVQGVFNAVMALNPIYLIAIAVGLLIAGIIYLATQTTFFQDLWTAMVAGITAGWEAFVGFFSGAIESIGSFFSDVFDGIGQAFKGYINFWIGLVEGFINFFITGINGILSAINSIKFTAPDWVPFIGGKSWGANIPMVGKVNLPRLAEGGMVMPQRGGVQAILAEAGQPEVVYPLDRFEKLMGLNNSENGGTITVNNYAPVGMNSEEQITTAIQRARMQVGW